MKKKLVKSIIFILIGTIIGSFVGCSNANNVKANEQNYLKYCGQQNINNSRKYITIYEDTYHNKVIYVGTNDYTGDTTIAVSDLNSK